jgi:hypothetical protein
MTRNCTEILRATETNTTVGKRVVDRAGGADPLVVYAQPDIFPLGVVDPRSDGELRVGTTIVTAGIVVGGTGTTVGGGGGALDDSTTDVDVIGVAL